LGLYPFRGLHLRIHGGLPAVFFPSPFPAVGDEDPSKDGSPRGEEIMWASPPSEVEEAIRENDRQSRTFRPLLSPNKAARGFSDTRACGGASSRRFLPFQPKMTLFPPFPGKGRFFFVESCVDFDFFPFFFLSWPSSHERRSNRRFFSIVSLPSFPAVTI